MSKRQAPDPTRQWTPQPNGGPDERERKINPLQGPEGPSRVWAETPEDRAKRNMEEVVTTSTPSPRRGRHRIITPNEVENSSPSESESPIKVELVNVDRAESEAAARKMLGVEDSEPKPTE